MNEMTCIHCGAPLDGRYHLNGWLSSCGVPAYECYNGCGPLCDAGVDWYAENTIKTLAGRMLINSREAAVKEQRLAVCRCPTALVSEGVLRRDWDQPEEDAAWKDL